MQKYFRQNLGQENHSGSQTQKPINFTSLIEDPMEKLSFRSFYSSDSNVDEFIQKFKEDFSPKKQILGGNTGNIGVKEVRKEKPTRITTSQESEAEKMRTDPSFSKVFKEKKFIKKNNNTVRFLIDLAVQYLPILFSEYPEGEGQKIADLCNSLRKWHLEKKKNVYNCDHLRSIFGEGSSKITSRKSREIFNLILSSEALNYMKRPRSQIKDKAHYLRVAKIFAIRCRHHLLSLRNQSR